MIVIILILFQQNVFLKVLSFDKYKIYSVFLNQEFKIYLS